MNIPAVVSMNSTFILPLVEIVAGMRLPITGQLLTLSMGVEGGWKNFQKKYYGKDASPFDYWLDYELQRELERRPEEIGNTLESAIKFRDKMLVAELKWQNLL